MLAIRFKRIGKKHQAAYRVVVSERRSKLLGTHTEDLGFYNPHAKQAGLKVERITYWLGVGAKPSVSVHNLFVREGILTGKKIAAHNQPKVSAEAAAASEKAEASAKPEETAPATPSETAPEAQPAA